MHAQSRMQQALEKEFVVQSAVSVREARNYLDAFFQDIDILISEVRIGPEDGLELCTYVRSLPAFRHISVMLLTSRATLQDKVAGFHAGTDDYVVKPFDAHHLTARIRLLARIKRIERHMGNP